MGKTAGKSYVECTNSSNPFHECSEYCLHKIYEAKWRLFKDLSDSRKRATGELTVHPDCTNALNPYHDCSEYCFKKIADAKADPTHQTPESMISMRKSNLECVNSSNPFHECSDYCLHRIEQPKRRLVSDLPDLCNLTMEERTVYPDSSSASNCYPDCSEHCCKKIVNAKADPPHRISR